MIERNCGSIVFNGSEDEGWIYDSGWGDFRWNNLSINQTSTTGDASFALCDKVVFVDYATYLGTDSPCILFGQNRCTIKNYNINQDIETFKKWLQANTLTVVYKLVEPYYEDIEPIQEDKLMLTTFKECNLTINSPIPADINVTYTTDVQSLSEMENQISEAQIIQDEQDTMILENAVAIATMQLIM